MSCFKTSRRYQEQRRHPSCGDNGLIAPSSCAGHGVPCPYCGKSKPTAKRTITRASQALRIALGVTWGTGRNACATGRQRSPGESLVVESAAMLDIQVCNNIRKNFERSFAGFVLCCAVMCLGAARAEAQTGAAKGDAAAESDAAAKVEAEIRHEQKYVERETPSDRQFSTVNSETRGTDGKIGNCDPKRVSSGYRGCDLTFVRKGKRESHRVMRPGVFPPTYFSGVHNDWGLWEESKDGRLRYFTLHTDGRMDIGAARSMPHSVH